MYDAVTTKAGRYVQGGGCLTVGVAGLIQSGGFGSFSKGYGMAAASLLEAEIVTADGAVRIANACTNPELFWAIKGGGGGSFGVVTRLTLRTHDLPEFFGAVFSTIEAASDDAFRRLISKIVAFYREALFNPHWGEQIAFRPGNVLAIAMVFQGIDQQQAEAVWRPFFDWVGRILRRTSASRRGRRSSRRRPGISGTPPFSRNSLELCSPTTALARPRATYSGPAIWRRPGRCCTAINPHGCRPRCCKATGRKISATRCLRPAGIGACLCTSTRAWRARLPTPSTRRGTRRRIRRCSDAFALAISAAEGPPAYPGIAGHEPDLSTARRHADAIDGAMSEVRKLLPTVGAYVSEADFFDEAWQESFWGPNYQGCSA